MDKLGLDLSKFWRGTYIPTTTSSKSVFAPAINLEAEGTVLYVNTCGLMLRAVPSGRILLLYRPDNEIIVATKHILS